MAYKLSDPKVLSAIDCIIKDVDKKFDECLVDKFLEFIDAQLQESRDSWAQEAKSVMKRLKSYIEHDAFLMFNQTRAFKVVLSVIKSLDHVDFEHAYPMLASVWNSLYLVIINNNLSAVTILLHIFQELLNPPNSRFWLIRNTIQPALEVQHQDKKQRITFQVKDLTDFARLYILTSNNYHTKIRAEKLLESLILKTAIENLPLGHPQTSNLKQTIRELMLQNSSSISCIMVNVIKYINKYNISNHILFEHLGWIDILEESLQLSEPCTSNHCKCLALTNSPRLSPSIILDKLKLEKNLEGVIVYISHSSCGDVKFAQHVSTYLLYPLLAKCNDENSQMLIKELIATRDERDFVDNNMKSSLDTLCLVQLNMIFSEQVRHLTSRSLSLIIRTLAHYIQCYFNNPTNYKSIMECCTAFYKLQDFALLNLTSEFLDSGDDHFHLQLQLLNSLHEVLSSIQNKYHPGLKTTVISLIKALNHAQRRTSDAPHNRSPEKLSIYWRQTVELASKFDDEDIVCEFANFFVTNRCYGYEEQYVKLIWEHMYTIARDTEQWDLWGNLAYLFIYIDFEMDLKTLEKFNIRRHHDIPKILGDIIIEHSAILPIVEQVIDALNYIPDHKNRSRSAVTVGYLCRLDSPTLPETVKENLDHLAKGICVAIKGEASKKSRVCALKFIIDLVKEIIINSDDTQRILKRLVQTGILETLYEVATGSLYSSYMYEKAQTQVGFVKTAVISRLDNPSEELGKHLLTKNASDNIEQDPEEILKIKSVVEFYTSATPYVRPSDESTEQLGDKMAIYSIVDDILNFDLLSDGINDCY